MSCPNWWLQGRTSSSDYRVMEPISGRSVCSIIHYYQHHTFNSMSSKYSYNIIHRHAKQLVILGFEGLIQTDQSICLSSSASSRATSGRRASRGTPLSRQCGYFLSFLLLVRTVFQISETFSDEDYSSRLPICGFPVVSRSQRLRSLRMTASHTIAGQPRRQIIFPVMDNAVIYIPVKKLLYVYRGVLCSK